MRAIKKLAYRLLGPEQYLRLVSKMFFKSYFSGRLRKNPIYYSHYYVQKLVKKGDHVIDIGANLGYYSVILAKLVGSDGKVIGVEPVERFRKILLENTRKYPQVEIVPYALGDHEGEIWMGIPSSPIDHGRMQVMDQDHGQFKALMRKPDAVFKNLSNISYIKIDIEGAEKMVFPLLMPIIQKNRPIVQIETGGETRKMILGLMKPLGYVAYGVVVDRLVPLTELEDWRYDLVLMPEKG